jgi:hypothetical protein
MNRPKLKVKISPIAAKFNNVHSFGFGINLPVNAKCSSSFSQQPFHPPSNLGPLSRKPGRLISSWFFFWKK